MVCGATGRIGLPLTRQRSVVAFGSFPPEFNPIHARSVILCVATPDDATGILFNVQ